MCVRTCAHACVSAMFVCTCWHEGTKVSVFYNFQDSMMWQSGGEKCNPTGVCLIDKGTTLGDGDRIPCGRLIHSDMFCEGMVWMVVI